MHDPISAALPALALALILIGLRLVQLLIQRIAARSKLEIERTHPVAHIPGSRRDF